MKTDKYRVYRGRVYAPNARIAIHLEDKDLVPDFNTVYTARDEDDAFRHAREQVEVYLKCAQRHLNYVEALARDLAV